MTYHRLVLREIAIPLALSLVLVSQLLIAMQLLSLNDVLFGSGFDALGLLRIASYFAPHFGIIAVPLAFLFAVMLGVGRLSEDGEVVALSALGRSPFHLYRVPMAMGVVLGLGVGVLSFRGEPWGLSGIRRQLNELIKRNVAGDITPGVFYEDIPRFTVYVGGSDAERGRWEHVLLHDAVGDGAPFLLLARRGRVESEGAEASLRLELERGELHRADGRAYTRGRFEAATVSMGVSDFFRRKNRFIRPAAELPGEQMLFEAQHARNLGDEEAARRIETMFHRRVASMFTCLIFGLIAVPLAAAGRGARGRSFLTTMAAFASYYVLLTLGQGLGDTGRWLPWAGAWLPNVAGLAVALGLGLRLHARPPGWAR